MGPACQKEFFRPNFTQTKGHHLVLRDITKLSIFYMKNYNGNIGNHSLNRVNS